MKIISTKINDLFILEPEIFSDHRGYFLESYKHKWFNLNFPHINFVQENESFSKYGVLRGLHLQLPPYDQTKLVRVTMGEVLDVAVDLRPNSKTYGDYVKIKLSDENRLQFLIPRGFAHGFIVLSDFARFNYKVDNYYSKSSETGLIWDDSDLSIDWEVPKNEIIISKKDLELPNLKNFKH